MVLSNSSSSRLTSIRTTRLNRSRQTQPQPQQNISDYLRRNDPLPASARRTPAPTPQRSLSEVPNNSNNILDGVIACLDVRTEDGDDVSLNFERALQSMGAKTRRTFNSITHLIFKNGSPATLKKAMSKNVFIVSLLWISSCKRQGKRVPENDFMIDKSQGLLVTTGKKRRKSMEPGKVRALVMNDLIQPSLSSSSEGSTQEEPESRRKTISTCSWEARDFQTKDRESKRRLLRPNFDEDPLNALPAEIKLKEPRLSLPASLQSIKYKPSIIPVHAPSLAKKEQIKARFSIGKSTEEEIHTTSKTASVSSPLKRRRRLTGNLTRIMSTDTIQSEPTKYVIVLTSVSISTRKRCEEAIKKFNHFELSTEVTEMGANRRTKSVTMGLLRGLWMLSPEWLVQSGEKNEIESEKEYELSDWYSPSEFRRHQLLLPSTLSIQVLSTASGTELVEEMIKMAGGSVVKLTEQANIIISDKLVKTNKTVVTDTWLFESIEKWQFLATDAYILG
ncbi:hypothetical protein INT48_003273 [Thamnidium elegans]|uniref:BRCT domain-containing protein n=1 Tax=Thamnidium elegans TaxID=101142 RepID=A0A8H7VYW3_9FUNG|nr:hypothetical protein INT48_003273 [Thamnidium elegans]